MDMMTYLVIIQLVNWAEVKEHDHLPWEYTINTLSTGKLTWPPTREWCIYQMNDHLYGMTHWLYLMQVKGHGHLGDTALLLYLVA